MARETDIETIDGLALYQRVKRNADGQIWNGSAFEAFNAAHWSTYALALTKTVLSSGNGAEYVANFPSLPAGDYTIEVYVQQGGSPAVTDSPSRWEVCVPWNGTSVITLADVALDSSQAAELATAASPATPPQVTITIGASNTGGGGGHWPHGYPDWDEAP